MPIVNNKPWDANKKDMPLPSPTLLVILCASLSSPDFSALHALTLTAVFACDLDEEHPA